MDADEIAAQGLTISKSAKPKYDLWTNPNNRAKLNTLPIGVGNPGSVNNSGKSPNALKVSRNVGGSKKNWQR